MFALIVISAVTGPSEEVVKPIVIVGVGRQPGSVAVFSPPFPACEHDEASCRIGAELPEIGRSPVNYRACGARYPDSLRQFQGELNCLSRSAGDRLGAEIAFGESPGPRQTHAQRQRAGCLAVRPVKFIEQAFRLPDARST